MASEPYAMEAGAIDTVLRSYRRALIGPANYGPPERPGFSGALVQRVETQAGPFCVRGWPQETVGPERILALHELLAYVRSQGIDYVAVPIASDEGSTLVRSAGRLWQLEPWLPGSADFWSRPNPARLAAAFVALARFHQTARSFAPAEGKMSHLGPAAPAVAPTVLNRIERIDRWTPVRLAELQERLAPCSRGFRRAVSEETAGTARRIVGAFERCAPRVSPELRAAARMTVPLQPCLRDVWHDHVLFQGDAVTGLIDPSAARTDTVAADLSRLAGSLIADDRSAWIAALEAYQSVRPLSAAEAGLVAVLDRSGVLLSGMAWLERPDFWREQPPEFQTRVLERLGRIAQRAEALARSIE